MSKKWFHTKLWGVFWLESKQKNQEIVEDVIQEERRTHHFSGSIELIVIGASFEPPTKYNGGKYKIVVTRGIEKTVCNARIIPHYKRTCAQCR